MTASVHLVRRKSPVPYDRGWSWMIVFGVFVCVFFMVGIAKSFGLILTAFMKEFDTDMASATMPMSVCAFVYAFAAPVAILLAEHFTTKKVVIAGGLIGFGGFFCTSFLVNMTYVTIMFGVCYGVGNSCLYGNGMIIIGKYFRKRRALATGLALAGSSIGQFAMPPIIEYFLENYGLAGTMMLLGAMYFHCCVAGSLFRPLSNYASDEIAVPVSDKKLEDDNEALIQPANENGKETLKNANGPVPEKDKLDEEEGQNDEMSVMITRTGSALLVPTDSAKNFDSKSEMQIQESSPGEPIKPSLWTSLKGLLDVSVLKNYISVFYLIVSFLCFFGYFNFVLFIPGLVKEKGITKYYKALLISICGIGDLIARITVGLLADKEYLARYKLKATGCLLCSFNILMFIWANSFGWLAVHSFLYGLFGGCYVCLMPVVLVDMVGLKLMAKNLAVMLLIQGIGAAMGQPLLGYLRDSTHSYDFVIIICSLTLATGAIILYFYPFVRRLEDARLAKKSLSAVE